MNSRIIGYRAKRLRRRRWQRLVTALACVVVFCTTYALILPALTMEHTQVLDCPYSVHTHTADCYDEDGGLICGQADFVVHTHDASCYAESGELVCLLPEIEAHVHTVACYTEIEVPICGLVETAGHQHKASCCVTERGALLCGNEDTEHEHGDECYEQVPILTCGMEKGEGGHTHTDSCYLLTCGTDAVSALTFQTEGFSVFAVVTVTSGSFRQVTDVSELSGQSVAILSNSAKYAMTAAATTDSNGRQASAVASTADLSQYTVWTFEAGANGTYYIKNNNNYLVLGAQTLRTTASRNQATAFTVTITNGLAEIGASVNGTMYYINLFGGENSPSGFKSWTDSTGNLQQLYIESGQQTGGTPLTELGGKSYAIVNLNGAAAYAMTPATVSGTVNGAAITGLANTPVSLAAATEGTSYVTGDDVPLWTFEAVSGKAGVYYIRASDGNYLNINGINSVTVGSSRQEITVTAVNGGQVMLSNGSYAVNWFANNGQIFSGYYSGADLNNYQTLCEAADADFDLFYDINLPGMANKGGGWQTVPSLESSVQMMDDGMTALYGKPGGFYTETGTAGIAGLYRYDLEKNALENLEDHSAWEMGLKDNWYGEERFDGWTCTAEDGTVYLFAPEAAVEHNGDGTISVAAVKKIVTDEHGAETITAIEETKVTLPAGTVLTGHWTEVSSPVMFFINYKGTILDTEGDVSGRRSDTFTLAIAVGHVFYGKLTVGEDQVFGSAASAKITSEISPGFTQQFDPDDPVTQIVIDYLRECTKTSTTGTDYETELMIYAPGANSTEVAANTLRLLRETGRTVQIATGAAGSGSPNPEIDNSLCDEDHYEIRWYVLKEQSDAWHIDGVLVAKTSEIAVTKTFSGLTTQQAQGILEDFDIDTKLGTGSGAQDYLKITTSSASGQYEYVGSDATGNLPNSYHWNLHAITDEKYTMTEEQYALDGYDVSSIIVHYYNDAMTGAKKIEYSYGDSTAELDPVVVGGSTTAVSFNNFYTRTGTGAMAIVKRDKNTSESDTYGMLPGAEFTLYSDEACTRQVQKVTTNANGTAYFSNMAVGTYYLKETKAPEGYTASEDIFQIVVAKDAATGNITVTLYQRAATGAWIASATLYDGGIYGSFIVPNAANTSTITVVKTFSGLTASEMQAIYAASKTGSTDGYHIVLQGDIGGSVEAEGARRATLTLDQAVRSNLTFTWTIHDLDVGTVDSPVMYTITENNYTLDSYVDVVVKARMTDPLASDGSLMDVPEVKDIYDPGVEHVYLNIDRSEGTATIYKAIFSENQSDVLYLSNYYTNTFDLKLRKVDANTGEPLKGADFKIYGPYAESTNTSDSYTYTDADGAERTVYYIRTVTSGADGCAVLSGLSLSNGVNTFVYVLDESRAPAGYAAAPPQVVTVVVEDDAISSPDGSDYVAGVLEYSAPNTKEEDYIHAALDTQKVWDPYVPDGATVTLELYRVVHRVRNTPLDEIVEAELVKTITLDGRTDPEPGPLEDWDEETPSIEKVQVYESAPWVATWMTLYSASRNYTEEDPAHYHYFIREASGASGFAASYTCLDKNGMEPQGAAQKLRVTDAAGNESVVTGYLLADMDESYTVTVTNSEDFTLPETGGTGTFPYAMGGALLMACSLLCGYLLRRKEERRYPR